MLTRAFFDKAIESSERNKVGDEDVGDERRAENKQAMLQHSFEYFVSREWRGIEFFSGGRISLNQAFNSSVDVIEKDGVGAGPSTPNAT